MNKGKRKELIAKGSELEPTVHIGKEGLSEGVVEEVRAQVKRSRLVKVRVLPNADLKTDEVASELAVATTWAELKTGAATDDPEIAARILRRAVRAANLRVHQESRREPGLRGMGTTLSGCVIAGGYLISAQIGDSRV
ncbi:MAG TPA: YhbY family RNA-binding protein, partial [Methanomassiliicoccaceae archaeon]|nr:YhbY family RNA-binding protein [Methanomassiliicoccaceae archaeon]